MRNAVLGLCAATLILCSCQNVGMLILKGPSNPTPHRFKGDKLETVEVVEWLHPHVFQGKHEKDGRVFSTRYFLIEQTDGYRVDDEGVVYIPRWVGVYGAPYPEDSTEEERGESAGLIPPGTEVVISFPLKCRTVIWEGQELERTVLTSNGYYVRIEEVNR